MLFGKQALHGALNSVKQVLSGGLKSIVRGLRSAVQSVGAARSASTTERPAVSSCGSYCVSCSGGPRETKDAPATPAGQ
jgi:hypothetical protein